MNNKLGYFLLIILLFSLSGCSIADSVDSKPSDIVTNIAVFDQKRASAEGMQSPMLMGECLFYRTGDWNKDIGKWSNTAIYRKSGNDMDAMEIASLENKELIYFTADKVLNLYYIYYEYNEPISSQTQTQLFIKKESSEGNIIYDIPLPQEAAEQLLEDIEQTGYIRQGTVNSSGELIVRSTAGNLYLFNEKGVFLCIGNDGWNAEKYQGADIGLANAGEDGVFLYLSINNEILLRKINMVDASLSAESKLQFDTNASLDVYSGFNEGILVSDSDSLWTLDPVESSVHMLLGWGDSGVGLKNYNVDDISILGDGRLYVMVSRQNGQGIELVYIEKKDISEITEKQTIVIGSYEHISQGESSRLAIMAEDFNKYNSQYQIEIRYYDSSQDLYMELLKGEGPDGFHLMNSSILAAKGVLEDLSPYFAESQVIHETDLIPSVRNACSKGGNIYCLFTQFRIHGLITAQENTDNGSWTPEEYLDLGERNPEALLMPQINSLMVMEYALSADMDHFLNWENRECSFDTERFINLLNSIRRVTDGKQSADYAEWSTEACQWLHDGKTLTERFWIGDVRRYVEYRDAYEDFASFAGYPNSSDVVYYCFEPDYVLAINSASENKDGAWAFMEYLLSETYQSSIQTDSINDHFPVRQDSFDAYITRQFNEWERRSENSPGRDMNSVTKEVWQEYPKVSAADKELLLYMAENAYWDDTYTSILAIIYEETGSFWAGDKTAEDTAEIIQNRVQLYLDEM